MNEQSEQFPEGEAHPSLRDRARSRRRRYLERYEQRRDERLAGKHHPFKRPIRVTIGIVLILAGSALGWLPGPGFVMLAIPGALLVASEWRRAALLLDRVEEETLSRFYRAWARLRGGPKPEWIEQDPHLWQQWIDHHRSARGEDPPDEDVRT